MNAAAQKLADWRNDPVLFVRENFGVEPDLWQKDVLRSYGKPGRGRVAMQACAGPGKTAGRVVRLAIPRDSVVRFVTCMGWPKVAATSRILATPHYLRHDAHTDTLGATNGQWVYVIPLPDSLHWEVLRHEWVHLWTGETGHGGVAWSGSWRCGGPPLMWLSPDA